MSTTVVTHMEVPMKPNNHFHKSHNNKTLKVCGFVSYTSTRAATARLPARCASQLSDVVVDQRRSGNYGPSLWDADYIQSLNNTTDNYYTDEKHVRRASELIEQVKMVLLEKETDPVAKLELIDELQRLALSDHFQKEIKNILDSIYHDHNQGNWEDFYSTALAFRLLRQHGFHVPLQGVLLEYSGEEELDTKGLLQVYEASFLLTEGETSSSLAVAREFAAKHLQEKLEQGAIDDAYLESCVRYSLDIPIHWRIQRPNATSWIQTYNRNPLVLELAKLDSNIVQAQFQQELNQDLRWWKKTCIVEKLPFARDRLVECYFWTTGIIQPRQHENARIMLAKVNALITTIDDVYDVYGTLEELQLFTDVIRRWDISAIDQLPSYMQLCFLALDNFVNDTAYDVLKDQNFNTIPYLRKSWVDLVEAYLIEAGWYYNGHKPNLSEYLNNAWISIGGTVMLTHTYFLVAHDSFTRENVDALYEYHDLVRWSSLILRLADDLGTSVDEVSRGDVPKSIQCYMNDKEASEEEARQHVKGLIAETWKKMNEGIRVSPFGKDFVGCAVDLARMAQYMYHHGDGHGIQPPQIHQQIATNLFRPCQILHCN